MSLASEIKAGPFSLGEGKYRTLVQCAALSPIVAVDGPRGWEVYRRTLDGLEEFVRIATPPQAAALDVWVEWCAGEQARDEATARATARWLAARRKATPEELAASAADAREWARGRR